MRRQMSEIRGVDATSVLNSLQDLLHPGAWQVLVWPGKAMFQHTVSLALKQGEEVQAGIGLEPNRSPFARVAFHSLEELEAHPLTLAVGRNVEEVEPRRRACSRVPARHTHQGTLGVSRRKGVLVHHPLPIGAVDVGPLGRWGACIAVGPSKMLSDRGRRRVHFLAVQRPRVTSLFTAQGDDGVQARRQRQGSSLRRGLSAAQTRRPR